MFLRWFRQILVTSNVRYLQNSSTIIIIIITIIFVVSFYSCTMTFKALICKGVSLCCDVILTSCDSVTWYWFPLRHWTHSLEGTRCWCSPRTGKINYGTMERWLKQEMKDKSILRPILICLWLTDHVNKGQYMWRKRLKCSVKIWTDCRWLASK